LEKGLAARDTPRLDTCFPADSTGQLILPPHPWRKACYRQKRWYPW